MGPKFFYPTPTPTPPQPPPSTLFSFFFSLNPQIGTPCACLLGSRQNWGLTAFLLVFYQFISHYKRTDQLTTNNKYYLFNSQSKQCHIQQPPPPTSKNLEGFLKGQAKTYSVVGLMMPKNWAKMFFHSPPPLPPKSHPPQNIKSFLQAHWGNHVRCVLGGSCLL